MTRRTGRTPAHRGWYIDHEPDAEGAWMHDEGDPCPLGICELLRRADEPRVADGLTGWRHAGVWGSGECDAQNPDDARYPCGCSDPRPVTIRCVCGHRLFPAPRPPEPDRTAALTELEHGTTGNGHTQAALTEDVP